VEARLVGRTCGDEYEVGISTGVEKRFADDGMPFKEVGEECCRVNDDLEI
jgi:hypothetical protein